MFLTSVFVLSWINLFERDYAYLFSILFIVVFFIELYIDFILISTYLLSPWFHGNNDQILLYSFKFLWSWLTKKRLLSRPNRSLPLRKYSFEIQLQNQCRRLMFSRIQKLFRQTILDATKNNLSHPNKSSLFNYRCPICFNHQQHPVRWIALGCGHILCSLCIQYLYFGHKPLCPNCRLPVILSDLTILYI